MHLMEESLFVEEDDDLLPKRILGSDMKAKIDQLVCCFTYLLHFDMQLNVTVFL